MCKVRSCNSSLVATLWPHQCPTHNSSWLVTYQEWWPINPEGHCAWVEKQDWSCDSKEVRTFLKVQFTSQSHDLLLRTIPSFPVTPLKNAQSHGTQCRLKQQLLNKSHIGPQNETQHATVSPSCYHSSMSTFREYLCYRKTQHTHMHWLKYSNIQPNHTDGLLLHVNPLKNGYSLCVTVIMITEINFKQKRSPAVFNPNEGFRNFSLMPEWTHL